MALPYIDPTALFLALLVSAVITLSVLAVAAHLHRQNRAAVPIRIHVAGSRGKTSTTRLLGAALREAGFKTLVKTTGTDPLIILPDGSDESWKRWAPPSISEQIRFFRLARKLGVNAVVLESMAIEPEYMWASEHHLVKATHAVITNARPDHVEALGDDPEAAARALALVVPADTQLFYTSEAAIPPISAAANQLECRGGRATQVPTEGLSFHDANCALALAVCSDLGIAPPTAALGFKRAGQDPGAFSCTPILVGGTATRFFNAFACNDPLSFSQLWQEHHQGEDAVVLVNTRSDRPERTKAFLDALAELRPSVRRVFITGSVPAKWLKGSVAADIVVRSVPTKDPRKLLIALAEAAGTDGSIWGVGNYAGLGKNLILEAQKRVTQPC